MRGILFALALASSFATLLAITPEVFAQTDVPDAPTAVAVYSIESQKLEVRWSTSFGDVDHRVQDPMEIGKRGVRLIPSAHKRSGDEHRKRAVDLGGRPVQWTGITGLTDGAEYTVRVIAANSSGDSDPSFGRRLARQLPQPGQAREFMGKRGRQDLRKFVIPGCGKPGITLWHSKRSLCNWTSSELREAQLLCLCMLTAIPSEVESNLRECGRRSHIFFGPDVNHRV